MREQIEAQETSLYKWLAITIHQGQVLQDRETPYLNYLEDVVKLLSHLGSDCERIGWLSSALTCPEVTEQTLLDSGVKKDLANCIKVLHEDPTQDYDQHIKSILEFHDERVVEVKIADIMTKLKYNPSVSQIHKYARALQALKCYPYDSYTVFCCRADGGAVWISTVEAKDADDATLKGREHCLADWGETCGSLVLSEIHCLGVAQGEVNILLWEDIDR